MAKSPTSSKKDKAINAYLKIPLAVGDDMYVKGTNFKNPEQESLVKVKKIDKEFAYFEIYGYHDLQKRKISEVRKSSRHIGENPFQPELRMYGQQADIESLMWNMGYDRKEREDRNETHFKVRIPEMTLNPMVIDKNGVEQEYQRGLVWTLEQKQLLIESIYNNVEIGKFVKRKRSWEWVEQRVKENKIEHTAFAEMVDGKQRFTTLIDFYENKFKDFHGNTFNDLSTIAQKRFLGYRQLTFVELDENTKDEDVIRIFLAINFTGVPMSREHIEYVKSINI